MPDDSQNSLNKNAFPSHFEAETYAAANVFELRIHRIGLYVCCLPKGKTLSSWSKWMLFLYLLLAVNSSERDIPQGGSCINFSNKSMWCLTKALRYDLIIFIDLF